MFKVLLISLSSIVILGAGYWALSGALDDNKNARTQHAKQSTKSAKPKEAGQAAFAAIAEIVAILQSDPKTDWSKVNISGLRDHLMDMEAVTTGAQVATEKTPISSVFSITGSKKTITAAQTMVMAHAKVLNQTTPWKAKAQTTAIGVTLTIEADTAEERQKLHALGFFGIMATGAHHQMHHFAMAIGGGVHAH